MTKILVITQETDNLQKLVEGISGIDPTFDVKIVEEQQESVAEGQSLLLWLSQTLPDETMNTLNYFCLSRIRDRLEETEQPQHFVIRGPNGDVLKAALLKGQNEKPEDRTELEQRQAPPQPFTA